MKVIHKYRIDITREQEVLMPIGSTILSAENQDRCLCVWAMADPDAPPVTRRFLVIGTGHRFESGVIGGFQFVGTVLFDDGEFVWHVFASKP